MQSLTTLTSVPPWAVFLAAALALSAGMLAGMLITVRHVAAEDNVKAKRSRHQRDPHGRGPASLDWIPDPPQRTRVPKGETVLWNPRTDVMVPTSVVDLPLTEAIEQIDYRRGNR